MSAINSRHSSNEIQPVQPQPLPLPLPLPLPSSLWNRISNIIYRCFQQIMDFVRRLFCTPQNMGETNRIPDLRNTQLQDEQPLNEDVSHLLPISPEKNGSLMETLSETAPSSFLTRENISELLTPFRQALEEQKPEALQDLNAAMARIAELRNIASTQNKSLETLIDKAYTTEQDQGLLTAPNRHTCPIGMMPTPGITRTPLDFFQTFYRFNQNLRGYVEADLIPEYINQGHPLLNTFGIRLVRGDGNCFYTALAINILDHAKTLAILNTLIATISRLEVPMAYEGDLQQLHSFIALLHALHTDLEACNDHEARGIHVNNWIAAHPDLLFCFAWGLRLSIAASLYTYRHNNIDRDALLSDNCKMSLYGEMADSLQLPQDRIADMTPDEAIDALYSYHRTLGNDMQGDLPLTVCAAFLYLPIRVYELQRNQRGNQPITPVISHVERETEALEAEHVQLLARSLDTCSVIRFEGHYLALTTPPAKSS